MEIQGIYTCNTLKSYFFVFTETKLINNQETTTFNTCLGERGEFGISLVIISDRQNIILDANSLLMSNFIALLILKFIIFGFVDRLSRCTHLMSF